MIQPRYKTVGKTELGMMAKFYKIVDYKLGEVVAYIDREKDAELICQLLNEQDMAERMG